MYLQFLAGHIFSTPKLYHMYCLSAVNEITGEG